MSISSNYARARYGTTALDNSVLEDDVNHHMYCVRELKKIVASDTEAVNQREAVNSARRQEIAQKEIEQRTLEASGFEPSDPELAVVLNRISVLKDCLSSDTILQGLQSELDAARSQLQISERKLLRARSRASKRKTPTDEKGRPLVTPTGTAIRYMDLPNGEMKK